MACLFNYVYKFVVLDYLIAIFLKKYCFGNTNCPWIKINKFKYVAYINRPNNNTKN
jgi:hypothetical protein